MSIIYQVSILGGTWVQSLQQACEGSIVGFDSAGSDAVFGRTLGLFDRLRDAVTWKDVRLIEPLIKYGTP